MNTTTEGVTSEVAYNFFTMPEQHIERKLVEPMDAGGAIGMCASDGATIP